MSYFLDLNELTCILVVFLSGWGCMTLDLQRCKFPFIHNYKKHYGCLRNSNGQPWCATDADDTKLKTIKQNYKSFGLCQVDCPGGNSFCIFNHFLFVCIPPMNYETLNSIERNERNKYFYRIYCSHEIFNASLVFPSK